MAFLEEIPYRTPHYAEHQQKRGVPFLCLPIAQCHFRTAWGKVVHGIARDWIVIFQISEIQKIEYGTK